MKWLISSLAVCALIGCINHSTETVPTNPFAHSDAPVKPAQRVNFAPAAPELSMRVDTMGRRILAANPQIGVKPLFATIGDPKPEIFHQGTEFVYLTAGLVGKCQTDGQLAAVLSQELGKMVSEREARVPASTRQPDSLPPPEAMIGQGAAGVGGDMIHQAELYRYEKKNPRRPNLPPPDPRALAMNYLEKAGFPPAELTNIEPILDSAEKNYTWERQIKGPRQADWNP